MTEKESLLMWATITEFPRRLSRTQTFVHFNDIKLAQYMREKAALL